MKLIKCSSCGQSINPKRDVCPFCAAPVERAPLFAYSPPPQGSQPSAPDADVAVDGAAAEQPDTGSQPWWKRRNNIISIVAAAACAAALLGSFGWYLKTQNDHKAETKKLTRAFLKVESALGVGITFTEYGAVIRQAQFAIDTYQPSADDKLGQEVSSALYDASSHYKSAYDSWNSDIQNGDDVDLDSSIQDDWQSASEDVQRAVAKVGP